MKKLLFGVIIISIAILSYLLLSPFLTSLPKFHDPGLTSISLTQNSSEVIYVIPSAVHLSNGTTLQKHTQIPLATITLYSISCLDEGIEAQCQAVMNLSVDNYNIHMLKSLGYYIPPINASHFLNYTGTTPSKLGLYRSVSVVKTVNTTVPITKTINVTDNYTQIISSKGYHFKGGKIYEEKILNGSNMFLPSFLSQIQNGNFNLNGLGNILNSGNFSFNNSFLSQYNLTQVGNDIYKYTLNQTNLTLSSFGILKKSGGYFMNTTHSVIRQVNATFTSLKTYNWSMDPPPLILRANYTDLLGHGFKTVWQPNLFGIVVNLDPTFSFPSGIIYYSALNVTNSQTTATPSPFQQMINVSSSVYSSYAASNLQNVEFFYSNGTIIPSWLENYTTTHAIWWVKVGSIPASSSITIYMGFAPTTTNLFNTVNVGEAPQLSSTYGEYDDGANVFLNYYNGSSITGWTTAGTAGQITSAPSGSPFGTNAFYALDSTGDYLYTTANGQSTNMIIEYYTYINGLNDVFFLENSAGAGQLARQGDGAGWYGIAATASWTSWSAPPDTGSWTGEWVLSGVVVNNGVATQYLTPNFNGYGSEIGQNPSNSYTVSNKGNYLGLVGDSGSDGDEYWNGLIIRAYPPNGVMPSVTFGSVTPAVLISLYLNGVKNANTTITYGTESNFTAIISTGSTSTVYVSLYINGTKVASLTQGKATYLKTLAAGVYKVTASTNISGVANVTYYETINKATPSLTVTDKPGNFTYNGTEDNTSALITTINNQLSASLYINGKLSAATASRTSYLNASANTYTAVFNTTGNQNYTSYSVRVTSVISKATPVLSLTSVPGNFTYNGTKMTITGAISTLNDQLLSTFTINSNTIGTTYTTLSYSNATANTYTAELSTNGNQNYTSSSLTKSFKISKATPLILLYLNKVPNDNVSIGWLGNPLNVTLLSNTLNQQIRVNLTRHSNISSTIYPIFTSLTTKNTSLENLSARETYYFNFSTNGDQNYTALRGVYQAQVTPANSSLVFYLNGNKDGNSTVTYGNITNLTLTSNNAQPIQIDEYTHSLDPTFSFPSGIIYYSTLTVNNSQTTATPSPFQQMINVSSSVYGSYAASNLQNVEFFYGNGTIIPSWLENYTTTHAIWWVKVGSIPASSSITIYMGFASTSTNLLNNVDVGEAPQLSATYGEYDDGANVFLNYYSGASDSGWVISGTAGQTTSAPSGSPFGTDALYALNSGGNYLYTVASGQSTNMIIEYYTYINRLNDVFFLENSTGAGQLARQGDGAGWYGIAATASWTSWSAPPDTGSWTGEWVLSGVVVNNGVATQYLTPNFNGYGSEIGQNPSNSYTVSNNGNYLGLVGDSGGSADEYWNGLIIRAYPPNGVMPSVTFGSVTPVVIISLYLNGVKNANETASQLSEINITSIVYPSTYFVGENITGITVNFNKDIPLAKGSATYLNSSMSVGKYKIVGYSNSTTQTQTFYLTITVPIITGRSPITYLNVLPAGNSSYIAVEPSSQNWTYSQIGPFYQSIKKHPITVITYINGKTGNQSFVYGTSTNITSFATNKSAITLQEAEAGYKPKLQIAYASQSINGTVENDYSNIFGANHYLVKANETANANFSSKPFTQTPVNIETAFNITKYPYTQATLTLPAEPSSYNQPLNFTCSYTSNITAIVPDIKDGQILNANSTAFTNVTPPNFPLPYSGPNDDYIGTKAFNISSFSTYCTAAQQNFTAAASNTIKYNLTLQKIQNATITSSILSDNYLNSTININTNTPYLKPVFQCNGIEHTVFPSGLSSFYSDFNASTAGQYDCFWNDTNLYSVKVSTNLLEASAVSPSITAISQKNISKIFLSNTTLPTFYYNYIAFPNLANISWTYNYTYDTLLSPKPNLITAYLNGQHAFNFTNKSIFSRVFTVPAATTDNYSMTYKWINSTIIKVYMHENLSYNDVFGSGNNISEYATSIITPVNLPNSTALQINNSCLYLGNLSGKGIPFGTSCRNYTLKMNYLSPITNISYSWIKESASNVTYENVTLTQDVLNQSLQGHEFYNITNLQSIPITAYLNTTQYKPKGWNESILRFTVGNNATKQVNIPAIGEGIKIINTTVSRTPYTSFSTFLAKWTISIPNYTAPWIKSNPIKIQFPITYLPYFENRNYTAMKILGVDFLNVRSQSITAFSSNTPTTQFAAGINSSLSSLLGSTDVLDILYNVPQQFITPPKISIGTPTFARISPQQYIGYIALIASIIVAIVLMDTKYKKQFDKFITAVKKEGKTKGKHG